MDLERLNSPCADTVVFRYWLAAKAWNQYQATFLFCGLNPKSKEVCLWDEYWENELLPKELKKETEKREFEFDPDRMLHIRFKHILQSLALSVGGWQECTHMELGPKEWLMHAESMQIKLPEALEETIQVGVSVMPDDHVSENERNSLLKMILGMAIAKYEYEIDGSRQAATGENRDSIHADINAALGMTVDSKTIRNYLKEAGERFKKTQK